MPKVSVIVPIYGVEKYLKEAIDSILNQTLEDLEIILIDDGSKDNCPKIIDDYAAKDNRIKVIHKANGGYGQTMNIGLQNATGEYIAILEPDDYIDSKMYEELYSIAKLYDSDIVKSCFFDNLQSSQETRIKKTEWKDFIPEDRSFTIKEYPFFLFYHPSIWSCIYKKEFIDKHNIRFVEAPGAGWTDNPFQVQTMCLAQKINYTSNAYYYWRRLNFYESDDLKDYTIPFKRCSEIHKWLDENGIVDEDILVWLYKRELVYINIVLGMSEIGNKQECYRLIKEMCLRMQAGIMLNNKNITKSETARYSLALKKPFRLRFNLLFVRFRKSLIRLRISSRELSLVLFGKTIFRRNYV